jgi:hypothetical protein
MWIMNIYTPDEQLHRQHADQCQRDRFVTRYLAAHTPVDYKSFGREIETAIAARLRESGYSVSRTAANEHFDLLVNGLRVEVKAACASGNRYCAALRDNDADVLILCCRTPAYGREGDDHYFVIPFDQVKGRTQIKISNIDPAAYAGRLSAWREAWALLDQLIARGVNHWQPALL